MAQIKRNLTQDLIKCSVPLYDIRRFLPLSGNSPVSATHVISVLKTKTCNKLLPTDNKIVMEKKEKKTKKTPKMNSYEEMVKKKRENNKEFFKSLEMDKVKADLSETIKDFKKKTKKHRKIYTKIIYPPASRRSERKSNIRVNYSEAGMEKQIWGRSLVSDKKARRDNLSDEEDSEFVFYDYTDLPSRERSGRLAKKKYDFSEDALFKSHFS